MDLIAKLLLGWLIADLATGFLHYLEDRIGGPDWPIVGKHIIAPNRLHHVAPMDFLKQGFIERNWTTWLAALPLMALWIWFFGIDAVLVSASLAGLMANEIHGFAHRRDAPRIIRVMQQTGFLQSRKGHARHHRPPQNSDFCTVSDWLNPWLEYFGLWRALDRLFLKNEKGD